MFQSILCPVDLSDHSIEALRFAIGLAGRDQAQLTVLTVKGPFSPNSDTSGLEAPHLDREFEKALRSLLLRLIPGTADWAPVPRLRVRGGNPHIAILECASEEHCDLIVMGTHGFGSRGRVFSGSVTERVLRHSLVPVLAVPLLAPNVVMFTDPAPVFHIGHVLAPVDFGLSTDYQIGMAEEVAESFGALLLLVHVLSEPETPNALRAAFHRQYEEHWKQAGAQLTHLASSRARRVAVETYVTSGRPAEEIAGMAAQHGTGLIVMGLTGEGGSHSRPGSVASHVLTMTAVPVLALPLVREERDERGRSVREEVPNGRKFWSPGA